MYDIFISFKDKDKGVQTEDSKIAEKIYTELKNRSIKTFFCKEEMEGGDWWNQVVNALLEAKILILVGTSIKYVNSPQLEREWTLFLSEIASGKKEAHCEILPYWKNIDINELEGKAIELKQKHIYDMDNVPVTELCNKIENKLSEYKNKDKTNHEDNRVKKGFFVKILKYNDNSQGENYDMDDVPVTELHDKIENQLPNQLKNKDKNNHEDNRVKTKKVLSVVWISMLIVLLFPILIYKGIKLWEMEKMNETEKSLEEKFNTAFGASSLEKKESTESLAEGSSQEQSENYLDLGRSYLYGINGKEMNTEEAVKCFNKVFDLGREEVYFYYGLMADYYHYPKRDYELARRYYESDLSNPFANLQLGLMYLYGKQVEKDRNEAERFFLECEEFKVIEANIGFGALAEYDGKYEVAIDYYAKALLSEEPFYQAYAAYRIARVYEKWDQFPNNYERALDWYKLSADRNFTDAMYNIAYLYNYGKGIEKDYGKAKEWYEKASLLGDGEALNSLGLLYEWGNGVEKNLAIAVDCYEKAMEKGSKVAIANLGNCYRLGIGVEQDYAKAMKLFQQGHEMKNARSTYLIGLMYEEGQGVEIDIAQAMVWYKQAAENGHIESINHLGWLYTGQNEIEPNYEKSMDWYQKGVEKGSSLSTMNMGWFYHYGKGVEQNYAEAAKWYQKAADMGAEKAKEKLKEVQELMKGQK